MQPVFILPTVNEKSPDFDVPKHISSKLTWLQQDSQDSKKLIPVNDGLWESVKDISLQNLFVNSSNES